ncbi:MAG: hypothetical protein AB7I27_07235 [Bacteriovoracaceae bacterium]
MKKLILSTLALTSISALAAPWNPYNNPRNFQRHFKGPMVSKLSSLPAQAKLSNVHYIWSDSYWPSMLGSVAYRWNAEPNAEEFKYKMYSKAELAKMSLTELEKLSPAEKFDIYNGNYSYPFTKKVLSMFSPADLWWEGICHGWSIAAVNHPEPKRVNLRNKDGIVVPFGSTDVKGLLSFYYGKVNKESDTFSQIGVSCKALGKVEGEASPEDLHKEKPTQAAASTPECQDTNAGAFHIVLTNMIGLSDTGLIAEVDRYNDVWNQPVGEYSYEILGERAATSAERSKGAVKIVEVKFAMTYADEQNTHTTKITPWEGSYASMDPTTGTPENNFHTREYQYTLELDSQGQIIGGEWISESRPDYIWTKKSNNFSSGMFSLNMSSLKEIYRPVVD